MLFLLTGNVQTGKTRWLERLVTTLATAGVEAAGVLAPGVWRERDAHEILGERGLAGEGRFEKLGIDNVLLPGGERIAFARRRDLALAEGTFDPTSQSSAAQLAWDIDDEAIVQVNAHFDGLAGAGDAARGSLLVVDELGRLELMRNAGLTSAVALLEQGPTTRFPHALVVVRAQLCSCAEERFAATWGGARMLTPDDASEALVYAAFDLV